MCVCALVGRVCCVNLSKPCMWFSESIIVASGPAFPVNRSTHTYTQRKRAEYKGRKREVSFLVKYIHFSPFADCAFLSLSSFLLFFPCVFTLDLVHSVHPHSPHIPAPHSPLPFFLSRAHSSVISHCFSTVHHYLSLSSPLSSITLSHRFPSYYCRMGLHLSKSGAHAHTHTLSHTHTYVYV